jgi:hypothetical protein
MGGQSQTVLTNRFDISLNFLYLYKL